MQTSLHNLELLILVQVTGCKRALESCVCGRSHCKGWTFSVAFLAVWVRTTTVCRLKWWTIRFLNSVELCSQPSVHTRNRSPLSYGNRSGWCPPKYHKNVHTLHKARCANSITFLPCPSPHKHLSPLAAEESSKHHLLVAILEAVLMDYVTFFVNHQSEFPYWKKKLSKSSKVH